MGDTASADWLVGHIEQPTSAGIASAVGQLIRTGVLTPGDRLPQVRELARQLNIGPSTVSAAWLLLRQRGLVAGRGKAGTRVAQPPTTIPAFMGGSTLSEWDLRPLYPDGALLPDLTEGLEQAARLPNISADYRERILPDLERAVRGGWPFEPGGLIAASGMVMGTWSVLRALSVPGDRVLLGAPTHPALIRLVKDLGLLPVPVDMDEGGMTPDALRLALATNPVAVVLQLRGHVPTGSATSPERLAELADILRPTACMVVEFDQVNQLSISPAQTLADALPGRVLLVRSYELSHGPDLSVAVAGGPASIVEAMHGQALSSEQGVSRILQSTLAWALQDPTAQAAVATARETYATRRAEFTEQLAANGLTYGGPDGLCVWVPVVDEAAALQVLSGSGVLAAPGAPSYPRTGPPHLRLAVARLRAGHADLARLVAAAARAR